MARESKLAASLDHPIFFTLLIALTTVAWLSILTFVAKKADMPGLAALVQHP